MLKIGSSSGLLFRTLFVRYHWFGRPFPIANTRCRYLGAQLACFLLRASVEREFTEEGVSPPNTAHTRDTSHSLPSVRNGPDYRLAEGSRSPPRARGASGGGGHARKRSTSSTFHPSQQQVNPRAATRSQSQVFNHASRRPRLSPRTHSPGAFAAFLTAATCRIFLISTKKKSWTFHVRPCINGLVSHALNFRCQITFTSMMFRKVHTVFLVAHGNADGRVTPSSSAAARSVSQSPQRSTNHTPRNWRQAPTSPTLPTTTGGPLSPPLSAVNEDMPFSRELVHSQTSHPAYGGGAHSDLEMQRPPVTRAYSMSTDPMGREAPMDRRLAPAATDTSSRRHTPRRQRSQTVSSPDEYKTRHGSKSRSRRGSSGATNELTSGSNSAQIPTRQQNPSRSPSSQRPATRTDRGLPPASMRRRSRGAAHRSRSGSGGLMHRHTKSVSAAALSSIRDNLDFSRPGARRGGKGAKPSPPTSLSMRRDRSRDRSHAGIELLTSQPTIKSSSVAASREYLAPDEIGELSVGSVFDHRCVRSDVVWCCPFLFH